MVVNRPTYFSVASNQYSKQRSEEVRTNILRSCCTVVRYFFDQLERLRDQKVQYLLEIHRRSWKLQKTVD